MNAFALVIVALLGATEAAKQPRVVVVDEQADEPEPGPVQTASDAYQLRLGALFEASLGKDQNGNFIGLPRARLRAEGLVSTVLEVGFVAEVDVSPFSSVLLKEDGPGPMRDLYMRMALGNKKVLDLGEARMGLFTAPILAEQWMQQSEAMWMTGSIGREAWLPGRELSAAYEASGYGFNVPVRGTLTLGSGIAQRGFPTTVPNWTTNTQTGAESAAANVPITAGDSSSVVTLNPGLSGRLEVEPLRRWTRKGRLMIGGGTLIRPFSTGADARLATAVDMELIWPWVTLRANVVGADTERAPFFDARSISVEGAVQVIPDFADIRARYELATSATDWEASRFTIGTSLFYLDGVSWGPIGGSDPRGGVKVGHAFSLLWMRIYDFKRFKNFDTTRINSAFDPAVLTGTDPTSPVSVVSWLLGGDADQVVLRVAL